MIKGVGLIEWSQKYQTHPFNHQISLKKVTKRNTISGARLLNSVYGMGSKKTDGHSEVHAHLRGHVHGPRAPAWACARRRCVRRRSIDARGAPQRKKRKQGRRRTKAPTFRHEARVAPRQTGRRRRRCTQEESNGVPPAAVRVPEPHFVLFTPQCRYRALRSAHTVARQPSSRKL